MYPAGHHPMFPYSMKERQDILEESGISEKQLLLDVETILDWYHMQPHLPEGGISSHMVELLIVAAKGSLEKTKRRIDSFFKYRYLAPEIVKGRIEVLNNHDYNQWDFLHEDETSKCACNFIISMASNHPKFHQIYVGIIEYITEIESQQVTLPKLYNGKRITVTSFSNPDSNIVNTENVFISSLIHADLRCANDFMIGDIWIVDLKGCTLMHAMKMNPIIIHKAAKILQDGTGLRIFGIHIINCGIAAMMQFVLNMMKQILSQKLFGRIQFHETLDSLYKEVPKQYLPSDYDGELSSINEMKDKYQQILKSEKTVQYLIEAANHDIDLTKKPKDYISDDYIIGTFKKLEVD